MSFEQPEKKLVEKLESFHGSLIEYWTLGVKLYRAKSKQREYPQKQWEEFQILRGELLVLYGGLKDEIEKYGGPATVRLKSDVDRNAFGLALGHLEPSAGTFTALEGCTSVVKLTIGKLKALPTDRARTEEISITQSPKAFVSHGRESKALDKLCRFLSELGIEPLVVKKKPSSGKALDDKVEHYMAEADCAIILATGDDKIDGKLHPRQNVSHEIGLAQKTFPDKIIYLLEEGVEFPSNIRPKVWEPFAQEIMDEAFIAIVRELKAFGLVKAIKG